MRGLKICMLTLATLLLASMQFGGASAAMPLSQLACDRAQCAGPSEFTILKVGDNNNNNNKNNHNKNNNKQSKDDDHRRIGPGHCPKGKTWNPTTKTCDFGVACPYLFAWDEDTKGWVGHRKVITNARGRAKQLTDIVELDKPSYRFRLRELEQEISFIDEVRLVLDLADGHQISLQPKRSDVASADGTYKKLYPGKRVEVSFSLPKDIAPKDVKRAQLSVTGYYVVIDASLSN
jgi:hypothetical protein